MTREEIEKIPKNVNVLLDYSVTVNTRQKLNEKLNKVCELAIKALEQEPCEDCISRQAAIDAIRRIGMCKCSTNEIEAIDECRRAVEALPFFTVEPKTEQESILDKIRAEIEETVLESLSDGGDDWFTAEKVNECLAIIDKYRQEDK